MHIPSLSSALSVFLLSLPLANAAPTDSQSLERRGLERIRFHSSCNDGQQSVLKAQIQSMASMAGQAANSAWAGNKYFDAYFGPQPSERSSISDNEIRGRLQAISRALYPNSDDPNPFPLIRCDPWNAPGSQRAKCESGFGSPAMTQLSSTSIWICNSYWRSKVSVPKGSVQDGVWQTPLDPFVPTALILLHEFTHAWYDTIDAKYPGCSGDNCVAYDQYRCLKLGKEDPKRARKNADNYRLFVASVVIKGDWSVDHKTSKNYNKLKDEL